MIIATHNKKFDADEVFGIAFLTRLNPDAEIWRTRDPELLKQADVRVDVGRKFSPPTDFDHHQFDTSAPTAVGQIARFYRMELFGSEEIYKRIYHRLIRCIEMQDVGARIRVDPPYLRIYSVSDAVAAFRPSSAVIRRMKTPEGQDDVYDISFDYALKFAHRIIASEIALAEEWASGQSTVKKLIDKCSSDILVMPYFIPWHKTVASSLDIRFVIYPNDDDSSWVVHAVPSGTEFRKNFPDVWIYSEPADFAGITGVEDAIFCHRSGFMAQTKTKEGALQLATLALDL